MQPPTGGVIDFSNRAPDPETRGFALIAVLGIVLIVSGVALALAGSMRTEVLQAGADRAGLEAEQLAASGQEMAEYLKARGLGAPAENLEGLPVDRVQQSFHYVVHFPAGDVDIYLDGEDGKLNLSTAPPEVLAAFFAAWTDDPAMGGAMAAAAVDWRDPDETVRPGGAETADYAPLGYAPRNRVLGAADLALLRGLSPEDYRDRLVRSVAGWQRRPALGQFLTNAPVGATVNPNFAPALVLRAIPGLDQAQLARILEERRRVLFRDWPDFASRIGTSVISPLTAFMHFDRRVPSVLTVARSGDGGVVRSERRTAEPFSVEYNVLPEFLR